MYIIHLHCIGKAKWQFYLIHYTSTICQRKINGNTPSDIVQSACTCSCPCNECVGSKIDRHLIDNIIQCHSINNNISPK